MKKNFINEENRVDVLRDQGSGLVKCYESFS